MCWGTRRKRLSNRLFRPSSSLPLTRGRMVNHNIPLTSCVSRHYRATIAQQKNGPLFVLSEALAHDSETTPQIYISFFAPTPIDKANRLKISNCKKVGVTQKSVRLLIENGHREQSNNEISIYASVLRIFFKRIFYDVIQIRQITQKIRLQVVYNPLKYNVLSNQCPSSIRRWTQMRGGKSIIKSGKRRKKWKKKRLKTRQ